MQCLGSGSHFKRDCLSFHNSSLGKLLVLVIPDGKDISCAVVQQLSQCQHTAGQDVTAGQGGDHK